MSSSVSDSYAGIGALTNIYQRLLGRGATDKEEQTSAAARDASFNLMELASPADTPPKKGATEADANSVSLGDRAAGNYDQVFTDPNALDFLMHCTEDSKTNFDSGKESLLVKFDPLRAKRPVSESFADQRASVASMLESDGGYRTESNGSLIDRETQKHATTNLSREKPTQVVNPAVNRLLCQDASRPPLVRSISAIMSPARVAIDRLVNYSNQPSPPLNLLCGNAQYDPHLDRLHSLKEILQQQEQDALRLREENSDLKFRIHDLEKKLQRATQETEELKEKENNLNQELRWKALSNKQMQITMDEYTRSITTMIEEKLAYQKEFEKREKELRSEQEQVQAHLLSMESAFNDLLAKYEKCKSRMSEFKELEESHRKKIVEYEEVNLNLEKQYETLKSMAEKKLADANETLSLKTKEHDNEMMKLKASIKKYEVQVSSLQESLAQKIKDNDQLTGICDELISKVH